MLRPFRTCGSVSGWEDTLRRNTVASLSGERCFAAQVRQRESRPSVTPKNSAEQSEQRLILIDV